MKILIIWSTFSVIYYIFEWSSARTKLFFNYGSAILAHSITRSNIISSLNNGFYDIWRWERVFSAKNLSFLFTGRFGVFYTSSILTFDQWKAIELHWNITMSVFSIFNSIGVMYLTLKIPFAGRYSTKNSFFMRLFVSAGFFY